MCYHYVIAQKQRLIQEHEMGYKWKPSATQRAEYAQKMRAVREFIKTPYAIRTGDTLTYVCINNEEHCCVVERHSYGYETNQHTFSLRTDSGELSLIKGRNLYCRLLAHDVSTRTEGEML